MDTDGHFMEEISVEIEMEFPLYDFSKYSKIKNQLKKDLNQTIVEKWLYSQYGILG